MWVALLIAVAAILAIVLYRHLLERKLKELEHRLQVEATSNEKLMELVQERHRKRLNALDTVNAALMGFDHDVGHLLQGHDLYARHLESSYCRARDLSRQYETLLGARFYQAVLRYTDAGEHILRSSFVLTNENLMQLGQRGFDAAALDRLRKVVGQRIPVIEAD